MKDHPLSPLLLAMLLIGLALPAPYLRGGNPSCANPSTPTQPPCPEEEPPTCPKCGEENPSTGSDSNNDFSTHTGTVFRRIVDLKMWGIIGEFGLKWERFGHSRFNPTARWFGHGHGWRHSFQWDVVEVTSNPDGSAKVVEVYDPSGRVDRYTLTGTAWVGAAANPAKLVQNGTSFTVEMRNAVRYRFERSIGDGGKPFYQLQDIRDSQGKLYQLFYDEQNRLVTVGAPHGGSLNVSYAEMEINRTDFTTIAQIPDAAPPAGQWSELLVNDPTPYRYLRYFGPDTADGAHAQVSEIEFYDENGVKIAGTPFGTSPAAGGGLDYAKAFDGNTSTSFKYLYRYYGFTGIDLGEGNAKRVSKVRYFPRAGFASQMKKGLFQGSTTAPQTVPVIARVDSSDGRAVIYRYTAMNDNLLATDWIRARESRLRRARPEKRRLYLSAELAGHDAAAAHRQRPELPRRGQGSGI